MHASQFLSTVRPLRMRAWLAASAASALLVLGTAQAAGLQVAPVRLQFEAAQQAQVLQVSNGGQAPLNAQVRVMRWSQQGGEDKLEPADEIVVSPAILRVEPGGQPQTVRLIRVRPVVAAHELSYRVLVDELPGKRPDAARTGLTVLMRYSIPVFIDPTPTAPVGKPAARPRADAAVAPTDLSRVSAQLLPGRNGKTELRMRNEGKTALRISSLSSSTAGGAPRSLGDGLIGYVLPGQQMSWPVDLPQPLPSNLSLKARFNDDSEARPLPLDGAGR